MLENIINLRNISVAELQKAMGYGSINTMYARIENPSSLTIEETRLLAKALGMIQRDLVEIICGSRSTYKRIISKI